MVMSANLVALIVGRAFVVVSSVVSVRLYTQALGAHEVGVMNLILSVVGLFTLLSGSIGQFFHQRVLEWQVRGRLLANVRNYCMFLVCFAAAASFVIPVVYWFGSPAWRDVPLGWLVLLLSGTLIVVSLNNLLLYTLNATGSRLTYSVLSNVASWGGLGMALMGVLLVDRRAEYWLIGVLGGQLISLALAAPLVWRLARVRADARVQSSDSSFRVVLGFSWPLVVCMALYWVQRSSYGPMMAAINDVATLGLFSVAFSIGLLAMTSFDTLFKDYYSPIYYRAIAGSSDDAKVQAWNDYMDACLPAILVAFVFTAVLADSLLQLFVSEEFRGLATIVAWGALCQALISIYSLYVVLASTFMDNRVLIAPNLWGAGVAAGCLYILLPHNPMLGAGLSIALGVLTTTVLTARTLRQRHAVRVSVRLGLRAVVLIAPLSLALYVEHFLWSEDSGIKAIVLLLCASAYMAAVQHRLARRWLHAAEQVVSRS